MRARFGVLVASLLSFALHTPALARDSRTHPVVWRDGAVLYAAWPAADGARPGALALLADGRGSSLDTLRVDWVRGAIAAFAPGRLDADALSRHTDLVVTALAAARDLPRGRLRVPLGALPGTFDPARVTSLAEKQVCVQVFEGLLRFDAGVTPVAALADSFGWDGHAETFRLREGARFHDGRPARVRDVVASFERVLAPGADNPHAADLAAAIAGAADFHAGRADSIAGLVALDSLRLAIVPVRGPASLEWALALPSAAVIPAEEATHPGFAFTPVGTGPFRFVSADTTGVVLRAAPGRFGGVDTLAFRLVRSPQEAALQFELDRLDLVSPPASEEARLRGAGATAAGRVECDELSTYYVGMNCRAPWLASRAHRRAVAAAIDRALAVRVLVPGRGVLAHGVLPPGLGAAALPDSAWAPPASDAATLASSAPPRGGLAFWVPRGSETGQRVAEFVQAALGRHGVRVRIESRPWADFQRSLAEGRADLFYLSWYAEGPDPWDFLAALVASPARGGIGNHAFYESAAVDSAFGAARSPADLARVEALALSDAPIVPLFHGVNVTLVRPWVLGYEPDPAGCPRYDAVEVTR